MDPVPRITRNTRPDDVGSVAPERLSIGRLPRTTWLVIGVLALSLAYLVLQVGFVRPYLWPAGHGLRLAGDSRFAGGSDEHTRSFARPLSFEDHPIGATIVRDVRAGSPAADAGVRAGDEVTAVGTPGAAKVDLTQLEMAAPEEQVALWRSAYRLGLRGDLDVVTSRDGATRAVTLSRLPVWRSASAIRGDWWRLHLGMIFQIVMFIGAALILLFVRTTDVTAGLCALALALSAVGAGGPLMGVERALPGPLAGVMTVFTWVAGPLAFPCIVLAMLYFPVPSPLIVRRRWLQAIPFLAAGPMIVAAFMTGLYLAGPEAAIRGAVVDATRPGLYFTSFALALLINVVAVVEGVQRYQTLSGALQRRVPACGLRRCAGCPRLRDQGRSSGRGAPARSSGARSALLDRRRPAALHSSSHGGNHVCSRGPARARAPDGPAAQPAVRACEPDADGPRGAAGDRPYRGAREESSPAARRNRAPRAAPLRGADRGVDRGIQSTAIGCGPGSTSASSARSTTPARS